MTETNLPGPPDAGAWARSLGLPFRSPELLEQALTHRSYAHEAGRRSPHGERLEFLGDSVLDLIVSEHLFRAHADFGEGRMTRVFSKVVSEPSLAAAARRLGLGSLLRLGRGERLSGGADRPSNLADALESLIGAAYLDCGFEATRSFVLKTLSDALEAALEHDVDAKSTLQELVQKRHRTTPNYELVSTAGPDHERTFECRVLVQGKELARGRGRSRRLAEHAAAEEALRVLGAPETEPRA